MKKLSLTYNTFGPSLDMERVQGTHNLDCTLSYAHYTNELPLVSHTAPQHGRIAHYPNAHIAECMIYSDSKFDSGDILQLRT